MNPHKPKIKDEASGIEVPNPLYKAYQEGIKEGIEEAQSRFHSPEVLAIADEALKAERKAGIRDVVEKLEKWQKNGTHLVSNEAIDSIKEEV